MTTEELQKICDEYKDLIDEEDGDRYLMMMAKEIERETRHECVYFAYDMVSTMSNLHKD